MSTYTIHHQQDYQIGRFSAMASPCEILIDTQDSKQAHKLTAIAMNEALRIEEKYSRYRKDNIIYQVNHSDGKPVTVDDETARLFDYAQQCYEISDGLFDVTSGVLGRIWKFDGSDNIPRQEQVDQILDLVGWSKLNWSSPAITLPKGMQVDFGGIGKEYAVDQSVIMLSEASDTSCLVNYGGDIRVTGPRSNKQAWVVGVEDPNNLDNVQQTGPGIHLEKGAIASSGDTRRFLLKNGVRYSHILNPRTGWPVTRGPRSVTVAANTCTEAGILSTLALLQEENAEEFLRSEGVRYWCNWQ